MAQKNDHQVFYRIKSTAENKYQHKKLLQSKNLCLNGCFTWRQLPVCQNCRFLKGRFIDKRTFFSSFRAAARPPRISLLSSKLLSLGHSICCAENDHNYEKALRTGNLPRRCRYTWRVISGFRFTNSDYLK